MLLIDGLMLVRRCHAKMDFLKNSKGQATGLEFGTLRSIRSLEKKIKDHKIVFCFDSPGLARPNTGYKANRTSMPDSFYVRVEEFKRFLRCFYPIVEYKGSEADHLLAEIARSYDGPHYIYTNDDDLLQCVDTVRQVAVLKSFHSKLFEWNEAKVLEKYGVLPRQLPLLRAFLGDKSDNLKGVPRISRKAIAQLICWGHECGMSLKRLLKEIKTADWSDPMGLAIDTFIETGDFWYNYELMKLDAVDWNEQEPYPYPWPIPEPNMDHDYVVAKLQEWEIKTLKLCEPFAHELCVPLLDEEF